MRPAEGTARKPKRRVGVGSIPPCCRVGTIRNTSIAQAFGRCWNEARRSGLLVVPSVVTGGRDTNVVVNPRHPDAILISGGQEKGVALERRWFGT
ncbi:RES domain-containing protein [Rhodopila sp.]|uniref:RES domain-containing protein n=1 Tax=Rhodopila sp. TaxID=2480087 RepID=UPI003D0CC00B